ncbi:MULTISPECIES: helix-turn-helix domain-containing protein [Bacillus]
MYYTVVKRPFVVVEILKFYTIVMINFSEVLKRLRKSRDLTQEQIAEQLNLTRSQIENGETNRYESDISTLILLASYFNVSVNMLIGYQTDFEDEPIKDLISTTQATYASLDEQQREHFCKQVEQFVLMIDSNRDIF